jgi:hypothetical protein
MALAILVAAVALVGAWRLAEGLIVVLGWGGLSLAVVSVGGFVAAGLAVNRTRLHHRGSVGSDGRSACRPRGPATGGE